MPVPGDNHPDMPDRDRSSIPTYEDACAESVEGRYPALRSGDGDGLSGYRPPTVESARSSTDTDFLVEDDMVSASEGSDPRRDMEQMEMLDPEHPMWGSEGGRVRITISKSLASITNTLSSLQSRLRFSRPSFGLSSLARIRVPDLYLPNLSVVVRLIVLFSVVALVYSFFVFQIFPSSARRQTFSEESLRSFLQGSIDEDRMRESLRYISSFEHIAGSEGGLYLTRWVEDLFRSYGLDSMQTLEYTVYLTYPRPRGRQVAITSPDELKWEATLEEESVYKDPSPHQKQSPSFHGLSKAGDVSGPLIYANTGSEEDFAQLTTWGINTAGSIILVKAQHGRLTEGLQLAAAEKAGAVGCLVYSDPGDDGAVDGATWPDGRKRPSDSLKRGSAGLTSRVLGDVLTPGWSSHIAASTRLTADEATGLANIPSLPLASRDAQRLLQAIKGKGRPVSADWIGAVPEVGEWWTGDASSAVVRLRNEQDEASQQLIYNVVGQIQGAETGFQKVIVGNHRDAWCFGSANPGR